MPFVRDGEQLDGRAAAIGEPGRDGGALGGEREGELGLGVMPRGGEHVAREAAGLVARAREEAARVQIQEIRERDLGNQVETEARQALLDLASARQQVSIAGERLRLAEQELAQAEERFQAGVAGSVETTNAQGSVASARHALIQARVSYGSARVSAYRALGVLDQLK